MNRPDLRFPGFRSTTIGPDCTPVIDLDFRGSGPEPVSTFTEQQALEFLGVADDADWETVRAAHHARLVAAPTSDERHRINTAYASLRLMAVD